MNANMNANAQQYNENLAAWNRQWSDAALGAVKAHEQFVTGMVAALAKPVAMENLQPQARQAAERAIDFTARQALEGEKFMTNMMRDGIENTRDLFKAVPQQAWPMDFEKSREAADQTMQQAVKTTTDVINREMAFVSERLNDAADFGRSMLASASTMATCAAAGVPEGETSADARNRARAKA